MKIIHTSDIHLGSKMLANLSIDKAKIRKNEILDTFENMFKYAVNNDIHEIIIAGDLFDYKKGLNIIVNRVITIIKSYKDINVFYVEGNHDKEIFSNIDLPDNFHLFGEEFKVFSVNGVSIGGLDITNGFKKEKIDFTKENYNILVVHGNIMSGKKNSLEDVYLGEFRNLNIDYLALGHIHQRKTYTIENELVACYSGCLEGRGFDELGDKGFYVLDINEKKMESNFVSFAKRRFYEVQIDITTLDDYIKIFKKIKDEVKLIGEDNLLKVVLTGKYLINLDKNISKLEEELNKKYFFAKIYDESSLEINFKDYENDISLLGEFVRTVYKDEKLLDKEKNEILDLGFKALNGEDLL